MKNREWINKMCTYDFLTYINEEEVLHCIVTNCTGKIDSLRCRKYNTCNKTFSLKECGYSTCASVCPSFKPDCNKCIGDFLNEERRCIR